MADILKLKKKAADFEAKKQMDKALATYREMIEVYERGEEEPIDIPLYNRVGDLLQKAGNLPEAVSVWERAVDHYAEGGFFNPAIALCNKILRQSPGRAIVYYKLGKISAEKGFKADARQNFLEYASRMQKSGNLDEAFRALTEFADLVPDQDDVRLMLADQLVKADRKDEAIAQLQIAYAGCVRNGRGADAEAVAARMKAIDPAVEPKAADSGESSKGGGLVFLDLDPSPSHAIEPRRSVKTATPDAKRVSKAIAGLELIDTGEGPAVPAAPTAPVRPVAPAATAAAAPASPSADALVIEPTAIAGLEPTAAPELLIEPTSASDGVVPPARSSLLGLETTALVEEPAVPDVPLLEIEPTAVVPDDLPILEVEVPAPTPAVDLPLLDETEPPPTPTAGIPLLDDAPATTAAAEIPSLDDAPVPAAVPEIPLLDDEPPSASPKVDLPMLEIEPPASETLGAAEVSTGVGDFSSFGTAETEAAMVELDGFEPLEVESSEGVHALPLDPAYVETPPPLIEAAPESPLPPVEPEPEPISAAAPADDAPFIEPPPSRATSAILANSVEMLRVRAVDAPEDWGLRRQLAEALLDDGQKDEGVAELEAALAGYERDGDLDTAASVAEEIVRLAPTVIRYHQKRVEFAFRASDRRRLAEAYVELADALLKDNQAAKARVVYQRVLEIAPDDLRAQAALETIADAPVPEPTPVPRRSQAAMRKAAGAAPAPPTPSKPAAKQSGGDDDGFISLGDWLREEDEPKSTRMVVEEKEPTGDEQADFADMLRKFKQGVSDNVDEEDHEAHYDLGVAYKEMGLLDEAISEFQKALRGANNRVRAIEALGQCFVEKGQLPVAATILQRALAEPGVKDEALIGVLYLLGTIAEELHLFPDAKAHYERVFAVDIQFRDIGDRLNAVEKQIK